MKYAIVSVNDLLETVKLFNAPPETAALLLL